MEEETRGVVQKKNWGDCFAVPFSPWKTTANNWGDRRWSSRYLWDSAAFGAVYGVIVGCLFCSLKKKDDASEWKPKSHVVEYGVVSDSRGNMIDEGLGSQATFFTVDALVLANYCVPFGLLGSSDNTNYRRSREMEEEMQPLPPPVQILFSSSLSRLTLLQLHLRRLAETQLRHRKTNRKLKRREDAIKRVGIVIEEKNWPPSIPIIHHDSTNEIPIHLQKLQY